MKKEKSDLKASQQRPSMACCLGGFFFKDYKGKAPSKSPVTSDPDPLGPDDKAKLREDLKKENVYEKKGSDVNYESAKFKELNCLEPPNFNFNPNVPPRPPLPPPYSVIPLLEYDAPSIKDPYPVKGLPSTLIYNSETNTTYRIGKLLGKGGFAKCFELLEENTEKVFAGKIISKISLTKVKQKEKILKEIELHSSLRHKHIVRFHTSFEDPSNVYIVLEHCSRKSLLHVLKVRKTLTECEARYYVRQLLDGVAYIHSQRIIHRDLKLGNMLLNEKMMVKIADFGLATRVEFAGEKKMTVCGTPNYIAPEVLQKRGHSYEADIWAVGCIIYALLVGQPPFETHSLKETYLRISNNVFKVPATVSPVTKELIVHLLKPHPSQRPALSHIISHEFFTHHFTPKHLPPSSCEYEPRFSDLKRATRSKSENHKMNKPPLFAESNTNNDNMNNNEHLLKEKNRNEIINGKTESQKLKRSCRISENHCPNSYRSAIEGIDNINNKDNINRISVNNNYNKKGLSKCNNSNNKTNISNNEDTSKLVTGQSELQKRRNSTNTKVIYTSRRLDAVDNDAASAAVTNVTSSTPTDSIFKYNKTSTFHLCEALNYCLNNLGSHNLGSGTKASPLLHHQPTWITKWVDYSNKYGFGFQLSDKNVGILFNDTTRMIISTDKRTLAYNDLSNKTLLYAINTTPTSLRKKVTLLMYFSQYMDEHLIHGAEQTNVNNDNNNDNEAADVIKRRTTVCGRVFVRKWFRTDSAIVMQLSNGTIQVNFLSDHTKLIVSCEDQEYVVTYINHQRHSLSYPLHSIYLRGCDSDVADRLRFARRMVESIVNFSGETV